MAMTGMLKAMGLRTLNTPTTIGTEQAGMTLFEIDLMIDTGADRPYLNSSFKDRFLPNCIRTVPPIRIDTPIGSLLSNKEASVLARMGRYQSLIRFMLVDLPEYDDGTLA